MESSIVMTNPLVWLKVQLEAGSVMESSIVMTNPLVGLKVQLATGWFLCKQTSFFIRARRSSCTELPDVLNSLQSKRNR